MQTLTSGWLRTRPLAGALITAILFQARIAFAVTIGFEGVAPPGGSSPQPVTPYVEAGFEFTSSGGINAIFDSATPGVNTNGSDIFGWCAQECVGLQTITLTTTNDVPFDLFSLDASNNFLGVFFPGQAIDVVGFLTDGGTVSQSLPLVEDTWTTFSFTGFTNLTRVEFSQPGPDPETPDPAMDNLVVQAIPEPSTAALLALGLAGLAVRGR